VSLLYGIVLLYHLTVPRRSSAESFLDRCRELCLNYGLVPTGHVANDAEAYLAVAKPQDLATPLKNILADTDFKAFPSEPHPLWGEFAPEFRLPNERRESIELQHLVQRGPVVLVFYYGYGCSHCVAQLFGLQKDLAHFRELGAEVIAVSADSPEHTSAKFSEYGRFDFPVVSDPDNRIAEQYGCFTRATPGQDEDRLHGTFLIDRSGRIIFANRGYQPFLDNKSLLFWLADQRPQPEVSEPANATPPDGEIP